MANREHKPYPKHKRIALLTWSGNKRVRLAFARYNRLFPPGYLERYPHKNMSDPSLTTSMIRRMETIQLSIGEISSRLTELVHQVSYFELIPFEDSIFLSDKHDVAIHSKDAGVLINVSEPKCGQPNLELVLLRDRTQLRQEITMLWQATRIRKELLSKVMNAIYILNSGDCTPNASVRMIDISKTCDLHITTVSRVLDRKTCLIDTNSVPCRDFIYGLR